MPKRHDAIKWTVERAAQEFGVDHRGLASALRRAGLEPVDGHYTTAQIAQAIYGDLEAEKIRTERARADLLEIELAEKRGSVVAVEEVKELGAKVIIAVRDKIQNSPHLLPEEKDELCQEIVRLGEIC